MRSSVNIEESNSMADIINETPNLETDELKKLFDEYKNRIDHVVQREQKKLLEVAEQESKDIVSNAWRKAQSMIAEAQERSQLQHNETKQKAQEEAEQITLEAKNRAKQIMKEIDEKIQKEAKDRTRREVERIISDARKEAKKQSVDIVTQSRREAEQITNEVTGTAKAQARRESSMIIAEARETAKKLSDDSIARVTEINGLLAEVMQKAEDIFDQFRTEMQAEFRDLLSIITRAKENMEHKNAIDKATESGIIDLDGGVNESRPFEGRRELKIIPPWDDLQIKKLVEFLQQVPNIRLAGQSGNEDNITIYIDIVEAIPLLSILKGMPLVASSYAQGDAVTLRLKTNRNRN